MIRKTAVLAMLAFGLLAGDVTAQVRQPERWYPPSGDSPCWLEYQRCTIRVAAETREYHLTPEQIAARLFACRNALGWCSLIERLRPLFGPDAEAVIEAVGEDAAADLLDLLETK